MAIGRRLGVVSLVFGLSLLGLSLAPLASAWGHPLWLGEMDAGVEKAAGTWQIHLADGAKAPLGLHPLSTPSHIAAVWDGWMITAVRDLDAEEQEALVQAGKASRIEQRIELRHIPGGGLADDPKDGRVEAGAVEAGAVEDGAVEDGAVEDGNAKAATRTVEAPVALPAPSTQGVVFSPTLLVDAEGKLRQLLYFEGKSSQETALYAVRWTGDGWSLPQVVSKRGPGTQIALSTALLADGTQIAAWAAYDGEDDEILWSRSNAAGNWSTPRPVTVNGVPDVTPTVHATASGGALLAWSGFDGRDYRIFLSSFDPELPGDGDWSAPISHGERGSVDPYFARTPSDVSSPALVVFQQADPRQWVVSEISPRGAALRSATTDIGLAARPVLASVDGNGVHLEWPTFTSRGLDVRPEAETKGRAAATGEDVSSEVAPSGTGGRLSAELDWQE